MIPVRWRLPLLALAGASLLAALWAGLARLGWPLPSLAPAPPPVHGPLIVMGFLGALIGLERAVALGRLWAYGAPVFAGLGGLALLLGLPAAAAHGLGALGAAFLAAIFVYLYLRHPATYMAALGAGAVLWLAGMLLALGGEPLYRVVPWWVGFLVLTIAGERLELSRLARLPAWMSVAFPLALGLFLSGLLLGRADHAAGTRLSGAGLVATSLWLLRGDIAWRTLARSGRPRFMAACLLAGHLWLGLGGALWVLAGPRLVAGPHYDAALHAVLVGFVFSMIFGHAPIILPAVLGVALPFRRAFYTHWALLHVSLLVRVAGDLAGWPAGARWGGMGNAAAIVLFLGNTLRAIVAGRKGVRDAD